MLNPLARHCQIGIISPISPNTAVATAVIQSVIDGADESATEMQRIMVDQTLTYLPFRVKDLDTLSLLGSLHECSQLRLDLHQA